MQQIVDLRGAFHYWQGEWLINKQRGKYGKEVDTLRLHNNFGAGGGGCCLGKPELGKGCALCFERVGCT